MSDIAVDAVVSLKLKLPPESAAIISEIIVGDRVFKPEGGGRADVPMQVGRKSSIVAEKPKVGQPVTAICARPACGNKFTYIRGKGMKRKYCSDDDCKAKRMIEAAHRTVEPSEDVSDVDIPRTAGA